MDKIFLRSGEYTIDQLNDIIEKFPNGITSYLETYYEVCSGIFLSYDEENMKENSKLIEEINESQGTGGLYQLAESLTDKFELLNKDREWDGEFFDEIDKFLKKELYEI